MSIRIKRKLLVALALIAGQLSCLEPVSARVVRQDDGQIAVDCRVSAYQWNDESVAPKAIVVIVHGFTQEGKSSEVLARELAAKQYLVLSLDQRGHGRWMHDDWSVKSGGKRRRRGAKVDYDDSESDLLRVCRKAKEQYPDVPLFCIGESAGSALVVHAAVDDRSELINGMVLSSPGTRPRLCNWSWVLRDLFSNMLRLEHPVDLSRYIATYASDDPRVCREMLEDPLDRNAMSTLEIFRTAFFVMHTRAIIKHLDADMPLLVVQGAEDHILQPNTVRPLVEQVRSKNKQLVVFPQFGHVLVGTSYIRPAVSQAINHWLESQIPTSKLTVTAQIAHPSSGDQNTKTFSSTLPIKPLSAPVKPLATGKSDRES